MTRVRAASGTDGPEVNANHSMLFGNVSWAWETFQTDLRGLSRRKIWGTALFVPGPRACTGPGAISIFLSMCEVQRAELGMGWMEPGQLGFRGGLPFISLSLSFRICKMGII